MVATAITVGAAAYGANQQRKAGKDIARGANAATALQREMYETTRADQAPWLEAGHRAVSQLERLNAGDYSGFTESPDYIFTRDQGIKALDRSAAARGTQFSGGQLAELARLSGGFANQAYGDYYNRIAQLAGMGQNASGIVAGSATNYANQAGANAMTAAGARADSRIAQASTYGQLGDQLTTAFNRWWEGRQVPQVDPITDEQWQSVYSQIPPIDQYAWRRGK